MLNRVKQAHGGNEVTVMMKYSPEHWARINDPVIKSPARYLWATEEE